MITVLTSVGNAPPHRPVNTSFLISPGTDSIGPMSGAPHLSLSAVILNQPQVSTRHPLSPPLPALARRLLLTLGPRASGLDALSRAELPLLAEAIHLLPSHVPLSRAPFHRLQEIRDLELALSSLCVYHNTITPAIRLSPITRPIRGSSRLPQRGE